MEELNENFNDMNQVTEDVDIDQNGQIAESEIIDNIEDAELKQEENINLGKFKDVTSLLTAYNNLQAEFTKKCQKLSEISKKTCDNNENSLPQQKIMWAEKVSNFIASHQEAKEFSKEISELLLNNTELYNSENALEKAWTKVLLNNFNALKQQMQNKDFLTQIVSDNAEVKDNIINNYISSVKQKHSPMLMNSKNGAFAISKSENVSTLEDASKLVRAMFK